MQFIRPDHRTAIEGVAEGIIDLLDERRQLYAVLGVILERIEAEAPHCSARTFAHIAQFLLNRSGTLHEVRDLIADLRAAFPVDSEVRE